MLDSESFSIFVPELEELMNEAPSADMVMDDPGIIPINIGSPAPFVELPDDNADAPKVEEVPVEPVSFTVPVSSEGSFSNLPSDNTESATGSIADVAGVNAEQEVAGTLNEGITLNVSSDITSDTAPAAEDNGVSLDVSSVDMSPVGDIFVRHFIGFTCTNRGWKFSFPRFGLRYSDCRGNCTINAGGRSDADGYSWDHNAC